MIQLSDSVGNGLDRSAVGRGLCSRRLQSLPSLPAAAVIAPRRRHCGPYGSVIAGLTRNLQLLQFKPFRANTMVQNRHGAARAEPLPYSRRLTFTTNPG